MIELEKNNIDINISNFNFQIIGLNPQPLGWY